MKKFNTTNTSDINMINIKSENKKRATRSKIYWNEREEKTLFILQMALGSKFSIIQNFLKGKDTGDIKNHFYSKLRTYLSIQISNLKMENFFNDIDPNKYTIKKVLSLVLTNKIPTMMLNKKVIKDLILSEEKKILNKNDDNINIIEDNEHKNANSLLKKKRGRPSKK